jgi:two-component system sensor histidine kinase HupT/HoxJ
MARVAHELRTPVSLISGSLENLQESLSTLVRYVEATDKYLTEREEILQLRADLRLDRRLADTAGLLEICAEGARRLSHVVDQLRATAPQASTDISDLRAAVDAAAAMAAYGRRTLPLVVPDFEPSDILVRANSQSLGQVLLNIVRNAFDALEGQPDARIDITARLDDSARKARRALLSIRDNGPGIAPEHRDRIFDEFFSTKLEGDGLGLGLSICRDILLSMGGSIRLLTPSTGTEFLIDLPVAAGPPLADANRRL